GEIFQSYLNAGMFHSAVFAEYQWKNLIILNSPTAIEAIIEYFNNFEDYTTPFLLNLLLQVSYKFGLQKEALRLYMKHLGKHEELLPEEFANYFYANGTPVFESVMQRLKKDPILPADCYAILIRGFYFAGNFDACLELCAASLKNPAAFITTNLREDVLSICPYDQPQYNPFRFMCRTLFLRYKSLRGLERHKIQIQKWYKDPFDIFKRRVIDEYGLHDSYEFNRHSLEDEETTELSRRQALEAVYPLTGEGHVAKGELPSTEPDRFFEKELPQEVGYDSDTTHRLQIVPPIPDTDEETIE
ncbi:MAG: hypothetical protein NXI00_24565, partial [Cytophagales bacterium]|nr:hypothetical protein [Cytophagales bacterium]